MIQLLYAAVSALLAATLVASLMLWTQAVRRLFRGQPLLPPEPSSAVPWGPLDLLVTLLLQLGALDATFRLLREGFGVDYVPGTENLDLDARASVMLASGVATLVACLLTLLWLAVRYRASGSQLGFVWQRVPQDVRLGMAAFVMLAPLVYGIQLVLVQLVKSEHPLLELLKESSSPRFFALAGFTAVVVAPFVEEVFFRLLLQGWMERAARSRESLRTLLMGGYPVDEQPAHATSQTPATMESPAALPSQGGGSAVSPRWPLFVSSALFAMAHWSHGPDPIPLFVLALGLGYLYRQTHRLVPSIVLHFCLNACTLALMWLSSQRP
ncbi:MAG: lysostaphin resistance A-like protein [Pirellulaceae bacterium]